MLNLRRTKGQTTRLLFNGAIVTVHVRHTRSGDVLLGFDAPKDVVILRGEVKDRSTSSGGTDASTGRPCESVEA